MIEIRDLTYAYGRRPVLKGINLTVADGETMVILGRSGCGKSTLLRIMVGLIRPDTGEVRLDGVDLARAPEERLSEVKRRIGVLFQAGALLTSMTVADNVALPLREHTRLEQSTIDIVVRMKLAAVGLSNFEDLYPSQLSGGMKKRAALARALAMDPKVLFCDEPSAGLDPIVTAEIEALIAELRQAFDMTIIIVTHRIETAFTIADRIIVLEKGEVLFSGAPDGLRDSDDPFIRQFLEGRPSELPVDAEEYVDRLTGELHGDEIG